ncbi:MULTISPECIES: glycosyltransferase family 9 protein [Cysteiniphilum]|nr:MULTISPECIES: glycosyltransferase family 9 protein [Cysteiniphilum]
MKAEKLRIAIIRRNGFGDLVVAIPLINYLFHTYPDCEITLFTDERNSALVKYIPHIHNHVTFMKGNRYKAYVVAAFKYRGKYDWVIAADWGPMKGVSFFMKLLNAKKNSAYVNLKKYVKAFSDAKFLLDPRVDQHAGLTILQLLQGNKLEIPESYLPKFSPVSQVCPAELTDIEKKLHFNDQNLQRLMVSVSNNRESSLLKSDKMADILNYLYDNGYQFNLVISCEQKDQGEAIELKEKLAFEANIVSTTSFDSFVCLVSQMDVFLIGDGGIMHLAGGFSKKQLCLFGGINATQWHPLGGEALVLYDPVDVNLLSSKIIIDKMKILLTSKCK